MAVLTNIEALRDASIHRAAVTTQQYKAEEEALKGRGSTSGGGDRKKTKLPNGMPPLGTSEYEEWLKKQQELANQH